MGEALVSSLGVDGGLELLCSVPTAFLRNAIHGNSRLLSVDGLFLWGSKFHVIRSIWHCSLAKG